MEEYEREFLEAVTENLAASIAAGMQSMADEQLFEDEETLTPYGLIWVQGYLTGRLSMLRGGSTGNPNLSSEDLDRVTELIRKNEEAIASQLYS